MANEITVTAELRIANGDYLDSLYRKISVDQTTLGSAAGIQTIGTSEETLSFGDVAAAGYIELQNLDSTNFVDWGFDSTTNAVGRLEAGGIAIFQLKPSTPLKMKADTAAVKVRYLLLSA